MEEPRNPSIYFNLGNVYAEIGNFSNALKYYTKSIELDKNQAIVYSALGILFQDNDNLNEAKRKL